jgi:hypothetical protein
MQDSNQSSTELWLPGMDNESSEEPDQLDHVEQNSHVPVQ